jgi:hypothetical protein
VEPNGYPFVPYSVESYGRLGQPGMKLLHALGDEAAGPGGVQRAFFVAGALRELSVAGVAGCVGAISSCTVRVWKCLQSPVGRGSGLACVCPLTSMGSCRVPACYVLFASVLFMWNIFVLLLMHLLGAADCVVASYVFVIIYQQTHRKGTKH